MYEMTALLGQLAKEQKIVWVVLLASIKLFTAVHMRETEQDREEVDVEIEGGIEEGGRERSKLTLDVLPLANALSPHIVLIIRFLSP